MTVRTNIIETRLSRRTVLASVGIATAGLTVAQANYLRATAAQSDELQDIFNITATTERFGVTFLGEGLASNELGNFDRPWPDDVVAVVTAARAQEQFHLDAFEAAGGVALVDTFTIPEEYLTSFDAFFGAVVEQETAEIAAQIAALNAFTELERPDLVKLSFQYAAEEAEHRLLANYTLDTRPANDIAFAPALFETV
ncbi:MAG: ferritin-like domain-containing protein, partial [Chloroflexota bacterium]|nr:ferritin-like domain-containing protein [Chloroflexota bacterium]